MDHQDWPGWPGDPHVGDDPGADHGADHSGDHAADHGQDDPGGYGHDDYGHDDYGHGRYGHDGYDADPYGDDVPDHEFPGHEFPGHGLSPDAGPGDQHGAAGAAAGHDGYPDDDPFAGGQEPHQPNPYAPDLHHYADPHDPALHDPARHEPAGHPLDGVLPGHDPSLVDHPIGADPDLDPRTEGYWPEPAFPPHLTLDDPPTPVDGYPWSDPYLLGSGYDPAHHDPAHHDPADRDPGLAVPTGTPQPQDLYEYAGEQYPGEQYPGEQYPGDQYADGPGGDGWQTLLGSDDPATSALARWWAPEA